MVKRKKKEAEEREVVDFAELLKKDQRFKSFRRIVKNLSEQINLEKMHDEVLRLHAGRKSRTLYLKRPGVDQVVDAALMDSAYRSRIAEIRVEAAYNLGLVSETVDKIRKHLMLEFRDSVEGLKTKGERISFADQYLTKGIKLMNKLERLVSTCDSIIKDIDQAGFTFKHVIDSMNILYNNKRNDKQNL